MYNITFELKAEDKKSLYHQIYAHIREEIQGGKLQAGEKIPSTRALAEYFHISRSTVIYAYEQLLAEGYIESILYKGYFVSQIDELHNIEAKDSYEYLMSNEEEIIKYKYQFSPNGIDMSEFPYHTWKKITKEVLTADQGEILVGGIPQGEIGLRKSISHYLHASRGVKCDINQIIIGAGNDYLLMLLEKIFDEKNNIAMEFPTYERAYKIFQMAGYQISAISLDQQGMSIKELEESNADMVYIMPSHQYPTGIVMPAGRRNEVLKWASKSEQRYIIEDDYDSEFRYKGKPIPALLASDVEDKVIYMGTFSKAIAPAIRISFMVLPIRLLERYRERCYFLSSTVSRIDQAILEQFINGGYFERYLNKMRKLYKGKHDYLLELLKIFEGDFEIRGENAGLHILLIDKKNRGEKLLIESAKRIGVKVFGLLEDQTILVDMGRESSSTILLGYGGLSKREIEEGIMLLKQAWL